MNLYQKFSFVQFHFLLFDINLKIIGAEFYPLVFTVITYFSIVFYYKNSAFSMHKSLFEYSVLDLAVILTLITLIIIVIHRFQ